MENQGGFETWEDEIKDVPKDRIITLIKGEILEDTAFSIFIKKATMQAFFYGYPSFHGDSEVILQKLDSVINLNPNFNKLAGLN